MAQFLDLEGLKKVWSAAKDKFVDKETYNQLIGSDEASGAIDTFKEIEQFLADYDSSNTLKSLIDGANTAANTAKTEANTYTDEKFTALNNNLKNQSVIETDHIAAVTDDSGNITTPETVAKVDFTIVTGTDTTTTHTFSAISDSELDTLLV